MHTESNQQLDAYLLRLGERGPPQTVSPAGLVGSPCTGRPTRSKTGPACREARLPSCLGS